jgi:hypothetical protein
MIERQEIYCHVCGGYVQFDLDLSMNGNHVLCCPRCAHEHCRVVRDGQITGERWASRNGYTYQLTANVAYTTTTTWASTSVTSSTFLWQSWANTTTAG